MVSCLRAISRLTARSAKAGGCMRALASGGEMKMNVRNGSMRESRLVGFGFGAVLVALSFAAGIASAGSYDWVTIDGNYIADGGACNTLDQGSDVIGSYDPNVDWQAILDWQIQSVGTWHNITTYPGSNGKLGFRFTVSDDPSRYDTLWIRAFDTDSSPYGGPFYWHCHTV